MNRIDRLRALSVISLVLALVGCSRPSAVSEPTQPATATATDEGHTPIKATVTLRGPAGLGPYTFADPAHGWTASGSTILATDDGGKTWRQVGALDGIRTMGFASPTDGWAATDTTLYATHDGGATWQTESVTPPADTQAITFSADGRHGAVTGKGKMLLTANGGQTWAAADATCGRLQWAGGAVAYGICGSTSTPQVLERSTDGGYSWDEIPTAPPCNWRASSSWVSPETGFLLCGGQPGAGSAPKTIYATNDGGKTWEKRAYADHGPNGAVEHGLWLGGYPAGIFFLDDQHGWLQESRGGLLATSDGGWTWHGVTLPLLGEAFLGDIHFFNVNDGSVIASESGRPHLLATHDGGKSWTQILPALAPAMGAPMRAFSATRALALGTFTDPGAVLSTEDGGQAWRQIGHLPGSHPVAISFPDPQHGWALMEGWEDPGHTTRTLYATADGGVTWRPLKTLGPPSDGGEFFGNYLSLVDEQTGYVWGPDVRVTHDGGATFTSLGTPEGGPLQWATPDFGWRLANGQLVITRDAGKSTAAVNAPCRIYPADALPGGTIWATSQTCPTESRNAVLVSHDYGAHWTVYDLGAVRVSRILAATDREAWLVDELGQFYITADGDTSK